MPEHDKKEDQIYLVETYLHELHQIRKREQHTLFTSYNRNISLQLVLCELNTLDYKIQMRNVYEDFWCQILVNSISENM